MNPAGAIGLRKLLNPCSAQFAHNGENSMSEVQRRYTAPRARPERRSGTPILVWARARNCNLVRVHRRILPTIGNHHSLSSILSCTLGFSVGSKARIFTRKQFQWTCVWLAESTPYRTRFFRTRYAPPSVRLKPVARGQFPEAREYGRLALLSSERLSFSVGLVGMLYRSAWTRPLLTYPAS